MSISLSSLPFALDALEPYMSKETLEFHYGKHHQSYVTNLTKMIAGTEYESMDLEAIITSAKGAIFNNAAQIYNHQFFWNSLRAPGGNGPTGAIAEALNHSFGNYDNFIDCFAQAAATQFGSGWAWLVKEGAGLKIIQTANAQTPLTDGLTPILTIDVWEHAYYIDYRNARPTYIKEVLHHLLNWDFAAERFA